MPRRLQIVIEESVEFLDKQLKQTRTASQKERLQILWWLKTGQVTQPICTSASLRTRYIYGDSVAAKISTGWIIAIA
jgi:hypothetical protein